MGRHDTTARQDRPAGLFFRPPPDPRRHGPFIGPQPTPRLSGQLLPTPPAVALGTAAEAPIDPRQTGIDQSRLQRAAARQHDHGHRAPQASAARGLHLDHLPHQPSGQIAGRVAVGLAQLGTVKVELLD